MLFANHKASPIFAVILLTLSASLVSGQTTSFAYPGTLIDNGSPAYGQYDFEFKLFDSLSAGTQQGATVQRLNVTATNGAYTVTLDFGATVFTDKDRFLEISYRTAGGGAFTILSPRQQILSVPYSIRSLNAANADALSVGCVNCVTSSQISSVNGSAVTGTIPVAGLPAGSTSYIQNSGSQQAANFSIAGTGSANTINAVAQYNLGGTRILASDLSNLFAGTNAGVANLTDSSYNSFFGISAGYSNTSGRYNSFFGNSAGYSNTVGLFNSFFGRFAGYSNTTGQQNSFFGDEAGQYNSDGAYNAFFGVAAGRSNTSGSENAFFGTNAGRNNLTGGSNSFFGSAAGDKNTTGNDNSFFGYFAGFNNTTGTNNSFFGYAAGISTTAGGNNAFFGKEAGTANTLGADNAFFGAAAGYSNVDGFNNAFFGTSAGRSNSSGDANAFFGTAAGRSNTTGDSNAFFGTSSGYQNTTGFDNSFFGSSAGSDNTTGQGNSFFGKVAGLHNSTGANNAFFGLSTGESNATGGDNAFVGYYAGQANTSGAFNTFLGAFAGDANTTGNFNTLIGKSADVTAANLSFATAIGSGATVGTSNTVVIGRSSDSVRVPGTLVALTLGTAGSTSLCRNASNQIASCSSSLRYKTDVRPFVAGLDVVRRLRPIMFTWRDGAMHDVGFGAEEVEKVEPLLITRNDNGEIEGVKYAQITTVLVNAVQQQQAQLAEQRRTIEQQQRQLENLKKLVCLTHSHARACK